MTPTSSHRASSKFAIGTATTARSGISILGWISRVIAPVFTDEWRSEIVSSGVHAAARACGPSASTPKVRPSREGGSACRLTDGTGSARDPGWRSDRARGVESQSAYIQTTSGNSASVYVSAASAALVRCSRLGKPARSTRVSVPARRRSQGITRPARSSNLTPGARIRYKEDGVDDELWNELRVGASPERTV